MRWLFIFLVSIPVLEAIVIVKLWQATGPLHTLMLIFITGLVGLAMARSQGFRVVQDIQKDMAAGRMPAPRMIDGVMILLAGALLMTPGLITDVIGFSLLVPGVRQWVRRWMHLRLERWIREGHASVNIRRF